jgi:hypothetical protein
MPDATPEQLSAGVFIGRNFLAPLEMAKLLGALEGLSSSWASSEALGLLGRGGTQQVRPSNLAIHARLDEIRLTLAPAALRWAKACGFRLPAAAQLQLFPVRMVGDAATPAHQAPHTDSFASQPGPPVCTNVFYARARAIEGGDLAVSTGGADPLADPLIVRPAPNTIVSFAGDRVHWVQPLHAGERLSVVINFY